MKKLLFAFALLTFLSSCKDEPCDGIVCETGSCETGECICPDRYWGTFCQLQKEPTAIKLTKIEVNNYEINPGGSTWDADGSAADIYIILFKGQEIFYTSEVYENANHTVTYTFDINPPIDIKANNITSGALLDKDVDDSNFVDALSIEKYKDDNGFPEEVTYNGADAGFTYYLSYEF